jgi:hypothetical protein
MVLDPNVDEPPNMDEPNMEDEEDDHVDAYDDFASDLEEKTEEDCVSSDDCASDGCLDDSGPGDFSPRNTFDKSSSMVSSV